MPENAEKFTHAPHARRGFFPICRETHLLYFYSRASCEARHSIPQIFDGMPNFYSRASCEARQWQVRIKRRRKTFLLTRLMRGATNRRHRGYCRLGFLLTRLMRGATYPKYMEGDTIIISTHAPHARRDENLGHEKAGHRQFLLTRLMRGATKARHLAGHWLFLFLLTRLMRGATIRRECYDRNFIISTHAPHARRDYTPGMLR